MTFELTDEEVRFACKAYIEAQVNDEIVIPASAIRFRVTQGYNGEMGGPSEPNKVAVIVEIK
ncbi:MAG: hypothetical protein EOO61_03420 [Hymenobacter sp.]|nr:MAG: hypothetical protein EOO61_03420 [Hymenobacter sp.]